MEEMDVRTMRNDALAARVIKGLESRNMEGYYVHTKEEALEKALELIPAGSKISWGGTMSVEEIGLTQALKSGDYVVYDRAEAKTPEEVREVYRKTFDCDFFLGSANAMTEDGVMVNVDGNSNRVSAYAFGPAHVLLIVGMNKVVKTEADAMSRARNEAAPINAQRFDLGTPCAKNGSCYDCKCEDSICCQILTTRFSKVKNRFKIILVNEDLGF